MAQFLGGIVGFAIGGPIGGLIGSTAGAIADRAIFGGGVQMGPRTKEFRVMQSANGAVVPLLDGTYRFNGQLIYASDIREAKHTTLSGGLFGTSLGATKSITFRYFVHLGILFCTAADIGPVGRILKVFRNNTLVYDADSGGVVAKKLLGTYRFRLGDDDLPDPAYAEGAGKIAGVGPENAVAWRDMAVLVLEKHEITDTLSIPQFSAVVTTNPTASRPMATLDPSITVTLGLAAWASDRRRLVLVRNIGFEPPHVLLVDSVTRTELFAGDLVQDYLNDPGPPQAGCCDGFDHFYFMEKLAGSGAGTSVVSKYDLKAGFALLGQTPVTPGQNPDGALAFQARRLLAAGTGGRRLFAIGTSDKLAVIEALPDPATDNGLGRPTLAILSQTSLASSFGAGFTTVELAADDQGYVWLLADNGSDALLVQCDGYAGVFLAGHTLAGRHGVDAMGFDPATNSLLILRPGAHELLRYSLDTLAIDGALDLGFDPGSLARAALRAGPSNGRLWLSKDSDEVIEVDTVRMVVARTVDTDLWSAPLGVGVLFDAAQGALIRVESGVGDDLMWLFLDRGGGAPVSLQTVMETKASQLGLDVASGEFDASALAADLVDGHPVGDRVAGRDGAEQLCMAYFFNPSERGRTLTMVKRGGVAVASVPAADIGAREGGASAPKRPVETRQAELTLPYRLETGYAAAYLDYQPDVQEAKRQAEAVMSRRELRYDWPLAFAAADAPKQAAEKLLKQQWASATAFEFSLPPKYLFLAPADPIELTDDQGVVHHIVLTEISAGAGGVLKCKGYSDAPESYVSVASGSPAPGTPQTLVEPSATQWQIFAGPAPEEVYGGAVALWAAAGPIGDATYWPGAVLYASSDGEEIGAQVAAAPPSAAATHGFALTALPAPAGGFSPGDFDYVSTVDVRLWSGTLETVAGEAALADGATNLLRVGLEYLQFITADPIATDTYRLSGLRRGLRGTDGGWGAHKGGDTVLLLDPATLIRLPVSADDLRATHYYLGGTVGGELTAYAYVPGGVAAGIPSLPTSLTAIPGQGQNFLSWDANPATDEVAAYRLYAAPGLGQSFGAAVPIATIAGLNYTHGGLGVGAPFTYFLEAENAVGLSAPTAGADCTTLASDKRYIAQGSLAGAPTGAQELFDVPMPVAVTLLQNLAGSVGGCATAPTGAVQFTLNRIHAGVTTAIGTMNIAAGATAATFTFSAAVTLAVGDRLQFLAPSPADATLAGPFYAFLGTV